MKTLRAHPKKRRRAIPISQARARLFDLFDSVLRSDRVVWIGHRDRDDRVALVSERYLDDLEARLGHLRPGSRERFRLEGSGKLIGTEADLERAFQEMRREQAELFAAKWVDLLGEE